MALGRIDHYEILEKLKQGGMGVVFKAHDQDLDRLVALKVLPHAICHDAGARARLRREARAEASLNHPNIAVCYEIAEAVPQPPGLLDAPGEEELARGPVLYLAMEYVPGQDLLQTVKSGGLDTNDILRLALQVLAGLEAAHESGVIHRDLKPGNIMVSGGRVKILDFGIAKVRQTAQGDSDPVLSHSSSEGRIMGTVAYMSPEQAVGEKVDARSDLFSLGIVLYELLAGRLPFLGKTQVEMLYARVHQEAPPLSEFAAGVPDELERIVRKLLAKLPADRYQSAHEVATDIQDLVRRSESGLVPVTRPRKRAMPGLAALILAAVVLAFAVGPPGRPPEAMRHQNLAVFPFANMTGDAGLDYLADGIAAGVLSDLVQLKDVNVVSQIEAWKYRQDPRKLPDICGELGVSAVLEGTLTRREEAMRVDVRLVNGRSGYVIWSGRFERPADEVHRLEPDITTELSRALMAEATVPAPAGQVQSAAAYDAYLKAGRALDDADNPYRADSALVLFREASRRDPRFALAYAGQSRSLWILYSRDKQPALLHAAEDAAEEAVKINPDLLEVRLARAQIWRATGSYDKAIEELDRVLAVNPSWDEAHLQLAACYRDAGNLDQAEESCRRALALRPEYWRNWNWLGSILLRKGEMQAARAAFQEIVRLIPDKNRGYEQIALIDLLQGNFAAALADYNRLPVPVDSVNDAALASNVGTAHFFAGSLERAGDLYRKAVELEPGNVEGHVNLGDLYVRQDKLDMARPQYEEALKLIEEQLKRDHENILAGVQRALLLAKLERCDAAAIAIREAASRVPANDAECAHLLAKAHALCGDADKALTALQRALDLGILWAYIEREDEFRSLRSDTRYTALRHPRALM